MAERKIQTGRDLRREMVAVAQGKRPAPANAGLESFETASAAGQPVGAEIIPPRKPSG